MKKAMSFNDVAIVSIKRNSYTSKDETMNLFK